MWKKTLIPALLLGTVIAPAAENLLPNPGFEEWGAVPANAPKAATFVDGQAPKGWRYAATSPVTFAADKSAPKSGTTALRITKESDNAMAEVQYFMLTVKPDTTYHFSVWIKGENLNLGNGQAFAAFLAGTPKQFWNDKKGVAKYLKTIPAEWTEITGDYTTGPDQTQAMVRVALPGSASGSLLVDDFSLTEVEK